MAGVGYCKICIPTPLQGKDTVKSPFPQYPTNQLSSSILLCRATKEDPANQLGLRRQGIDGGRASQRCGHFSECPEEYEYFCVKGRCRYVVAVQTPSCICEKGYTGERCERLDLFYLRGDQSQVVVVSLIVVMVMLIILIAYICTCTQLFSQAHRRQDKKQWVETNQGEKQPRTKEKFLDN
uniref:Betacellulin n=1 Tax=Pseudonaja textilis TaxID=8673 RepID=A0A670ZBZ6_PSETE